MPNPESKRPKLVDLANLSPGQLRRLRDAGLVPGKDDGVTERAPQSGSFGPGRGMNDLIEALLKAGMTGPATALGAETSRAGQATGGRMSGVRFRDAFTRAGNPQAGQAGNLFLAKHAQRSAGPSFGNRSGGGSSSGGLGGGGALGGGGRFSGGSPQRNEFQRDQKAQKDRAQLEKERRDSILFEEGLRRQREMEKFNLIRSLIGGLPKTRESTTQQLVNVAGGHIPKTLKTTQQIDYTDLLRGLF